MFLVIAFIFTVSIQASQSKAIVLDLGGIFFDYSRLAHAQNLGLGKICAYAVLDRKNPAKLQNPIFEVVKSANYILNPPLKIARSTKGVEYPPLLTAYQAGRISSHEALFKAMEAFKTMNTEGYFVSEREAELVRLGIEIMFTPEEALRTYYSLEKGIKLLQELASLKDENGERKYLLIGLSNWDKESFPLVRDRFEKDFALFDDIIISGHMGTIKPNREIFELALAKHNLVPDECIFIDDQIENIEAAQEVGIHNSILFKDYAQVRTDLQHLGIHVENEHSKKPYLIALCGAGIMFVMYFIFRSAAFQK